MVVRHDVDEYDKDTVGCILTFNGEYIVFHRTKDNTYGSVAGTVMEDEDPFTAVKRVLEEKLDIHQTPVPFKTTFHEYDGQIVRYNIYHIELNQQLTSNNLLTDRLDGILQTDLFRMLNNTERLYPDENYCLTQHFLSTVK